MAGSFVGLGANTCRADLIVGNADPMDQTVSENRTFVVVSFNVINTGVGAVTITGFLETASPDSVQPILAILRVTLIQMLQMNFPHNSLLYRT